MSTTAASSSAASAATDPPALHAITRRGPDGCWAHQLVGGSGAATRGDSLAHLLFFDEPRARSAIVVVVFGLVAGALSGSLHG